MLKWNRGVKPPSTAQTGRLGAVLFFLGLRPGSVLNDARRGCAPSSALLPMRRALRPSKGDGVRLCLTLLPDEKVTKESPRGGHPLWVLPLGGIIIPPAARACMRLLLPPERVCATNPDRFATLRQVSESVFFLPESGRGHTSCFQTVARQGELVVRVGRT